MQPGSEFFDMSIPMISFPPTTNTGRNSCRRRLGRPIANITVRWVQLERLIVNSALCPQARSVSPGHLPGMDRLEEQPDKNGYFPKLTRLKCDLNLIQGTCQAQRNL